MGDNCSQPNMLDSDDLLIVFYKDLVVTVEQPNLVADMILVSEGL